MMVVAVAEAAAVSRAPFWTAVYCTGTRKRSAEACTGIVAMIHPGYVSGTTEVVCKWCGKRQVLK